ncbi:retrotransposon protein, putative, ty1-copia subclass [Tanacetum coccineum]
MHNMGKTVSELHAMLIEYEKGLPKKAEIPQVMMIKGGKIHKSNKKSLKDKVKGKANGKRKDKQVYIPKPKNPKPSAKEHPAKDDTCHHCKEVGHYKRNCPAYLAELIKKKKQVDTASSSDQLTPPYTPQHNEVSKRRNRTLLDMVSILWMNLTTLQSILFEDYASRVCNTHSQYRFESNKWIDAMNAEIQSMMDNMVWVLVDLPPGCKTIGSKWIFKKKTDMDGIVHTYKARLVLAKGYTKLYGVDYEEQKYASFKDPFMVLSKHQEAGIKDLIRKSKGLDLLKILMSHVYIKRPSGKSVTFLILDLGEAAFILGIKIYRDRMDNFQYVVISHAKKRLDLNKTQGASTPEEVKRMQNVYLMLRNVGSYGMLNTKDMFLVYGGNPEAELRVDCYYDARFETDRDDTKSQTRYVFILNRGAVDWKWSKVKVLHEMPA